MYRQENHDPGQRGFVEAENINAGRVIQRRLYDSSQTLFHDLIMKRREPVTTFRSMKMSRGLVFLTCVMTTLWRQLYQISAKKVTRMLVNQIYGRGRSSDSNDLSRPLLLFRHTPRSARLLGMESH